jgi:hypothetical protein
VVYRFVAPRSGTVTVSICSSSTTYDTLLYVRSSTCSGGTEVACNDDSTCTTGGTASRVTFSAVSGTTYYIFVDGYGTNSGSFRLSITGP